MREEKKSLKKIPGFKKESIGIAWKFGITPAFLRGKVSAPPSEF
jgi:hypothetical protein